ncbi:MAG: S-layer homology domain-containing protein [Candidatus Peregrinibacteria bacterium]
MHRFFLLPLLFVPVIAFAASGESMLSPQLQQTLDQFLQEQSDRLQSATREGSADLFPAEGSGAAKVILPASPFIIAKVDGYPVTFTDVPSDAWFAPFVREIIERTIVSGYRDTNGLPKGLYGPVDNVTVGQLAKIAVQLSGTDTSVCQQTIKNRTASGTWTEPYVRCCEKRGWSLYSGGSVDTLRPATRADVVLTVLQALSAKMQLRTGKVFTDVDSSIEFGAAIETAATDGVVSGYTDAEGKATGLFGPNNPVNRAEVAKIVTKALQIYGVEQ